MNKEFQEAREYLNLAIEGLQRDLSSPDQTKKEFQLFRKKYHSELDLRLAAFSRNAIVMNAGHTEKFKQQFPLLYSLARVRRVEKPIFQGNNIVYKTERYYEIPASSLRYWIDRLNDEEVIALLDFLAQEMNHGNLDDLLETLKYCIQDLDLDQNQEDILFLMGSIARTMTSQDINSKVLLSLYGIIETRSMSMGEKEKNSLNRQLQRIKEAVQAYQAVTNNQQGLIERINNILNPVLEKSEDKV